MNTIKRIDSWSKFMSDITSGKRTLSDRECASQRVEDEGTWAGTRTYAEAMQHLTHGWKEGIKDIRDVEATLPKDLFDDIMPTQAYKPELTHVVAGGTLDVGKYLTGASPENFITERSEADLTRTSGAKIQTIYVNLSNSSMANNDCFLYRGAYSYLLVEHLESCGYSTEVWGVMPLTSGSSSCKTYIKIKDFGELFDSNKLAISLVSRFMLRRFMFAICEMQTEEVIEEFGFMEGSGYGQPDYHIKTSTVTLPDDAQLNPIFINAMNVGDKQSMLEMFKQELKSFTECQIKPIE